MFSRAFWAMGGRRHPYRALAGASRFFAPGEVRLAILSLVAERPCHGYYLMKLLAERSGGVYRASAGAIYPTLQELEDEGLVTVDQQNAKRVYRVTEEGDTSSNAKERPYAPSGGAPRDGGSGGRLSTPVSPRLSDRPSVWSRLRFGRFVPAPNAQTVSARSWNAPFAISKPWSELAAHRGR